MSHYQHKDIIYYVKLVVLWSSQETRSNANYRRDNRAARIQIPLLITI